MCPNEYINTSYRIVAEAISQLMRKVPKDFEKIDGIINDIKDSESDNSEIIKLLNDYTENMADENKIFKEIICDLKKLQPVYDARIEIQKGIQAESDELLEHI